MLDVPAQRAYRLIVLVLIGLCALAVAIVGAAWVVTRPAAARQAATRRAAALPGETATPLPTPIPTLAGVRPELLLLSCRFW